MKKRSSPRIVGGDFRGRPIEVPPGSTVRPMRTRVRESLFGHLGPQVEGATVVDIFAGSGAIGLEALSRGAVSCRFVERDPAVRKILEQNIDALRVRPRAEITERDAYALIPGDFSRASLVFLDPPFPHFESRPDELWGLAALAIGCESVERVSIERPATVAAPSPPDGVRVAFERTYGDTALVVWAAAD